MSSEDKNLKHHPLASKLMLNLQVRRKRREKAQQWFVGLESTSSWEQGMFSVTELEPLPPSIYSSLKEREFICLSFKRLFDDSLPQKG